MKYTRDHTTPHNAHLHAQERRRLETIIEAVAIINPKQVEHLKTLQLAFQFKPRKVLPSKVPEDYLEEMSGSKRSAAVEEDSIGGGNFSGLLDDNPLQQDEFMGSSSSRVEAAGSYAETTTTARSSSFADLSPSAQPPGDGVPQVGVGVGVDNCSSAGSVHSLLAAGEVRKLTLHLTFIPNPCESRISILAPARTYSCSYNKFFVLPRTFYHGLHTNSPLFPLFDRYLCLHMCT